MTALQRRVQIRETIRTHLRRERELYPKGIKVLSLFFIDEVAKYRLYDGDSDDGRNGEYARMFEEEYQSIVDEPPAGGRRRGLSEATWTASTSTATHQGYFSIDRKEGEEGPLSWRARSPTKRR